MVRDRSLPHTGRKRAATETNRHSVPRVGNPNCCEHTIECVTEHDCVIASGGVWTGLDVAKAIALGAHAGGLVKPFLKPATNGPDAVIERVEDLIAELQTAMFVTGSGSIEEFQQVEYVLQGETREYVEQRISTE